MIEGVTNSVEVAKHRAELGQVGINGVYPGTRVSHYRQPDENGEYYRYLVELPGKEPFYIEFRWQEIQAIGQPDDRWPAAFLQKVERYLEE
jgi:hypothetical protein